jgi:hypothetical protein
MAAEASDTQPAASSTSSLESEALPPGIQAKIERIVEACNTRDLDGLISLATSEDGFVSDELRQRACTYTRASRPLRDFGPSFHRIS